MQYNFCKNCLANNGRAGNLINGLCLNCHDTKESGGVVIHINLPRYIEEIERTISLVLSTDDKPLETKKEKPKKKKTTKKVVDAFDF